MLDAEPADEAQSCGAAPHSLRPPPILTLQVSLPYCNLRMIIRKTATNGTLEIKRRQRGIEQMENLLRAAELTFVEHGYERATTIQIAERASISPGSLYQYFRNKEEFAQELARCYAARLVEIKNSLSSDHLVLPPDSRMDRIIDPFVSFFQTAPAFTVLFLGSSISESLRELTMPMNNAVRDWLTILLQKRRPGKAPSELSFEAEVCTTVFRAFVPLMTDANPRRRSKGVRELKRLLSLYLRDQSTN